MKEPLFKKVCIVGVGLIGGSLGLAIKQRGLAKSVVGIVRREQSIEECKKFGAVDNAYTSIDLQKGLKDSDLVILSGPINNIIEYLRVVHRYISKNCIVIDVGSTKQLIDEAAAEYFNKPDSPVFVGCHPMAGAEKTGVSNSLPDLFDQADCIITSENKIIREFWQALGSTVIITDSKTHDYVVAESSHIPHVVAFAMFQKFEDYYDVMITNPSVLNFARLAKSDPDLWCEIFLSNKANIASDLKKLINTLQAWLDALSVADAHALKKFMRIANEKSPFLSWKEASKKADDKK